MSKATNEEMKQEALERIDSLVKTKGLNPKVGEYFSEGRLYYSYLTAGGFIGSIDTISYNPSYESKVKSFERLYDVLVYHCIEDISIMGETLIMMFVSRNKDDWRSERPNKKGNVMANVLNFEMNFDEIGTIKVDSHQGALIRIG